MTRTAQNIDHLSHSSVSTYLRCPKQWAAYYLDELPRRPGSALIKGKAVDAVATANWRAKGKHGTEDQPDMPLALAQDLAESEFRAAVDEAGGRDSVDWKRETFTGALDSTLRLTRGHMLAHAPLYNPIDVQVRFIRPIEDFERVFVGYLDALLEDGTVIDVKTATRTMRQEDADKDLQASAYAYGLDRPIDFTFARIVDSGRAPVRAERIQTTRSEAGVQWYGELVGNVDRAIDASIFPANPGWACGFCPLASSCVGAIVK